MIKLQMILVRLPAFAVLRSASSRVESLRPKHGVQDQQDGPGTGEIVSKVQQGSFLTLKNFCMTL
jgi:hypothetical protein